MNSSHSDSIENRIRFLYRTYIKKYQLDKIMPEWDDAELEELGHSLRSAVSSKLRERQRALERCVHMRARFKYLKARS